MKIGIDATNLGQGGGITHLKEILFQINKLPCKYIEKIIVFSSKKVLDQLPDSDLISKLTFPLLNKSLFHRVIFQVLFFDKEINKRCDILFSITGDYLGRFKPLVGMSRNMLLYERSIWKEIEQPKERIRFWLNYHKQKRSFSNSTGIIFISKYARDFVSKQLDFSAKEITIIHHGVSNQFKGYVKPQNPINFYSIQNPYCLLYVSTVHVYKHQWNVVKAIGMLREKGYPVKLDLVGGVIFEPAGRKLQMTIQRIDPNHEFIYYHGNVPYEEIDNFYKSSDGIIFASTCENMPNILIESMASGIPIACSNKQPMPEFLKENGFYFDSKRVDSIVETLITFINSPIKRKINALNALNESSGYSWEDTSIKTFKFLKEIYKAYKNV